MTEVLTTPELTYDPYAKIVVNTHQPVYSGVTPVILEAHQVTSLKNNESRITQRLSKLDSQIESVREYLVENYDELEEHADEIARILGIQLTNEVVIDVNVTFSVTMTLPIGIEADSVDGSDFSFSLESENSDYEVQDYDSFVVYCSEG